MEFNRELEGILKKNILRSSPSIEHSADSRAYTSTGILCIISIIKN